MRPYFKKPITKKRCSPEFKPQSTKRKKERKKIPNTKMGWWSGSNAR
jgi:hypothetical protein